MAWRHVPEGEEKALHLEESAIFAKEPFGASLGSLDSGVSNEVVPFGGRSPEDGSSELGGITGCSGMMEGSNRDHLYFLSKKM